jgi:hypothetical protein
MAVWNKLPVLGRHIALQLLRATKPDDPEQQVAPSLVYAMSRFPEYPVKLDPCGAAIVWSDFGDTTAETGWEIDHIIPVAHGGTDDLDNLQALQWENNRAKGDALDWECPSRRSPPSY